MDPLTLAISPCPNDTFIFHAWVHGLVPDAPPITVRYADVDEANGLAARGEVDVAKVSYAALPELLERYALLPCGGALGRGCGPLVLTRSPAAPPTDTGLDPPRLDSTRLAGATVAVPGEQTTAYLLFRLWAATHPPARVVVLPFPQIMPAVRDGSVDAGLVIHEARFTYGAYGLHALADLGAWWERETGLPIPLGAIVARRELDLDRLAGTIRRSLGEAWDDPGRTCGFVLAHAQEMDPEVARRHIALYVNAFSHDLGTEGFRAVEALLARAAAVGLVPPTPARALRSPTRRS